MGYRSDKDIDFIGELASEDLNDLVYCLTHDKDGEVRFTESLTVDAKYKQHYPDHHAYWTLIAAEIQCFGANSIATMLRRGEGVLYKEVLTDVCDKLSVNYNKSSGVEVIEGNLLMKIATDAIEKMSESEVRELAQSMGLKDLSVTKEIVLGSFQAIFRAGGFKSYQLTLIIVNAVLKALIGRGLSLAGNVILTRTMSILAGPIGWAVTGVWTAVDIASPAYRVTVPAVIQVAFLRRKYLYAEVAEEINFS
ncbi:DUF3944 domain-containing protein [Acidovorax sp. Root217]|uniref:DUF3944 domain-containing protein n=1 Tax=Acidovorax sp. Root217 TaxID=1736492 RepID=UPI0009E6B9C2|nr:DUF3944 domain-containing protein [Acidovorax sp. Root217]